MNSTVQLDKPNHIISLATSAVLVSVDVNVWSATKQDREISSEVTLAKRADQSAGRFVKNLLADDQHHKRISNYRQTIYNWLKRNTYRWNNSQDLLPVQNLMQFKTEYAEHEAEFHRLLDNFIANYSHIVSDMAFKQGDMFNRDDYPTVDEVRGKFGIKLYVSEVPTQDFRCKVSEDLANDLKQQYEQQAGEIITGIMEQQADRLAEVLHSISHCCGYQEIAELQQRIRTGASTAVANFAQVGQLHALTRKLRLEGNELKQSQDLWNQFYTSGRTVRELMPILEFLRSLIRR